MKLQRLLLSMLVIGLILALMGGMKDRVQALETPESGDPATEGDRPFGPAGVCPHDPEGGGPSSVTLDECYTTANFIVYYTTDTADGTHRILNEGQAQWVADNLEIARDRYMNDPDFGLPAPLSTGQLEVWVYDITGLGVTSSSWNRMGLDAGYVRGCDPVGDPTSMDCLQAKATPLHELLHRVQYTYAGFGDEAATGLFAVEGHTKFMEDEVFADLDDTPGTQYHLRSNAYFANPNWDVTTASYNACIFWKYFAERYGAATDEPEVGVDVVRHFWEQSNAPGVAGIGTVNLTLDSLGHPSVLFRDVFRDWIAANYTKDVSAVPNAKYGYIDDDVVPYSSVPLVVNASIGAGDYDTRANQSVERWGAKYYRVQPEATCGAINFQFKRDSGTPVYHVITIKDDELIDHWSSATDDWSKTVIDDDYDAVVGIVGGYGAATQVDVSYGCADLTLDIVDPTTTAPAFVGSILDPEKFLVRLAVTSTHGIKIEGLNAQDFAVTVGTRSADVILGAYVQSQYWLLVQAPTQTAAGDYDLSAAFGAASDTESVAIKYVTRVHDDMLIIDRSGSMLTDDKLGAAQNAARLYSDATADGNMLGLVSFGEDATLDHGLAVVNSTIRTAIKNAVSAITTTAPVLTSIGDGLDTGLTDLEANGDAEHPCAMVLLSDGVQTAPSYWDDVKTDVIASRCVVDTIALGPNTAEGLLQEIASLTGGAYHYVPDENPAAMTRQANQTFGDWRNELAGTYEFVQGDVDGRSRLFETHGHLDPKAGPVTHTMTIEDDVTEAIFFVNLSEAGREVIQLYDPTGYRITCEEPGVRCVYDRPHILYHIMTPTLKAGLWTMVVHPGYNRAPSADLAAPTQGVPYLAGVSGNTHNTLHVFLGAPLSSRLQGVQMPILAALAGGQPILGAEITALVQCPAGVGQQLQLFDDGEHGDGQANDGLYGNLFTLSNQMDPKDPDIAEGSCRVSVQTDGVSGKIGPRYGKISFALEKDADDDGDGIPNNWENTHGLNKSDPDDASEDPDLDGLDNLGEYNNGTDPHNSDTDGGGENDGSEVTFDQDPLDPSDDEIPAIAWVNAAPHISATVLTFGSDPDYSRLRLFRSIAPDTGYSTVENNVPPTGPYTDTFGVENDTTYYYRMMAVDGDGHRSAVSPVRDATPKEDPFPPSLIGVLINDGAASTIRRDVTLSFYFEEPAADPATQDVAEVLLANEPTFTGAAWQPYSDTLPWTLTSTLSAGDVAEVYAKFRDAALNESPDIAGDSILYESGFSLYLPLVIKSD